MVDIEYRLGNIIYFGGDVDWWKYFLYSDDMIRIVF